MVHTPKYRDKPSEYIRGFISFLYFGHSDYPGLRLYSVARPCCVVAICGSRYSTPCHHRDILLGGRQPQP